MKFCETHWGKLRKAIEERGMTSLVASDGEEAVARMMSDDPKRSFDPLMHSHNTIVSLALDFYGLDVMVPNDDGSERCPVCYAEKWHEETCQEEGCTWTSDAQIIGSITDGTLAIAKELGLVGES